MLTIPFAVYLIGLALVLHRVFRRAGEDDGSSAGRLARTSHQDRVGTGEIGRQTRKSARRDGDHRASALTQAVGQSLPPFGSRRAGRPRRRRPQA